MRCRSRGRYNRWPCTGTIRLEGGRLAHRSAQPLSLDASAQGVTSAAGCILGVNVPRPQNVVWVGQGRCFRGESCDHATCSDGLVQAAQRAAMHVVGVGVQLLAEPGPPEKGLNVADLFHKGCSSETATPEDAPHEPDHVLGHTFSIRTLCTQPRHCCTSSTHPHTSPNAYAWPLGMMRGSVLESYSKHHSTRLRAT